MSFDVCPIKGLTAVGKHIYKLIFLTVIYFSWAIFFVITIIILKLMYNKKRTSTLKRWAQSFKIKLIIGLVEIIKYTYGGFCGIIFMSLVCTQIGTKYVWWYDGTNVCLENWQILMVIFAVFYALPFPLILILGLKMLKQNEISAFKFICSCLCPLIALHFILLYKCVKPTSSKQETMPLPEASEAIISVLQGPYRDDAKHMTLYWEAMVSIRRLLVTAMTLVSYASIRMIIITAMSLIFLVQHNYISPFQVPSSNDVEALSLSLLLLTSVINLLKASLTDSSVVPSGPTVPFFKSIGLCEKLFVLIIIGFILMTEFKLRRKRRKMDDKMK